MADNLITLDREEVTKAITSATLRFQARLMKLDDVAAYLAVGRTYAKHIAEEAGAVRRLGASWLCDRTVLDAYLSERTGDLADPAEVARWRGGKHEKN